MDKQEDLKKELIDESKKLIYSGFLPNDLSFRQTVTHIQRFFRIGFVLGVKVAAGLNDEGLLKNDSINKQYQELLETYTTLQKG